jgi:hypothetical protein
MYGRMNVICQEMGKVFRRKLDALDRRHRIGLPQLWIAIRKVNTSGHQCIEPDARFLATLIETDPVS